MKNRDTSSDAPAIAVVGMAGRFPGAPTIDRLWRNLRDGVESVTTFSDAELAAAGVDDRLIRNPNYVKSGAILDDLEGFDAGFFGFNPKEAAIMDPQHRQFLECAWEALEHAGHVPERFGGSIGVYAGCGMNSYFMFNLLTNRALIDSVGMFLTRHTGNDKDFLPTRVSYAFNLNGPSVAVQTACSTSLVAIHLACQSLLGHECDMAIAGGVTIEIPHRRGYLFQEGEILSHDGHCRPFDAASTGTIFGSGAGVVVLRRLDEALADGDCIHAVIRGSAINNDGSLKVGYLAPSVDGQTQVIAEALALAGVSPDTIGYVEMHGSGTPVGDPIEVTALTEAFRRGTRRTNFCGIGSIKSNVGHLDTAAGVAGFIKTVLALKHRMLPPSLHFRSPNPRIDFASSPFYVNGQLKPWTANGTPRRAGVTSLGVGGTNAYVVVEEAPAMPRQSGTGKPWQLLALSARSATALDKATDNLSAYLRDHQELDLADVAHTTQIGRRAFGERRIVACRDLADAAEVLASRDPKRVHTQTAAATPPSAVFLFPGGGAQYPNMGLDLYREYGVYRDAVDEGLRLMTRHLAADLRAVLYPTADRAAAAATALERPSLALPALFITEYALARLWMAGGVTPSAMAGHSMGEYTAACLAGVMTLDDALMLVTLRGRLFEQLPEGGMLSVPMSADELRPIMPAGLSIAAINGPSLCVASGRSELIARLQTTLAARDVETQRLKISVAAHSEMLDGILDAFGDAASQLTLSAPELPYVSNVSGTWIEAAQAQDPRYWVEHLRRTVRFADGLDALLTDAARVLIEVGPGHTLSTLARQHPAKRRQHSVLPTLRHPQERTSDLQFFLTACGRVWAAGAPIDFAALNDSAEVRRVPLPAYPFEHERYWIEPGASRAGDTADAVRLTRTADVARWFARPAWTELDLPQAAAAVVGDKADRWLVFTDRHGLGASFAEVLRSRGATVVTVADGHDFAHPSRDSYVIRTRERADYDALFEQLHADDNRPAHVAHFGATGRLRARRPLNRLDDTLDRCFYSLLYLAQAAAAHDAAGPLDLFVVSQGVQQVDREAIDAARATVLGPCAVIPREFPLIRCLNVDLAIESRRPGGLARQAASLADRLARELAQPTLEPVVAYRGEARWVQRYESIALPRAQVPAERLRPKGVYLLTGGLGGLALTHAEHLARDYQARLVLVARSALPERSAWDGWLTAHGADDATSVRIRGVKALEAAGAEVLVCAADVADAAAMRRVVADTIQRFGTLHGVIHAAGAMDDAVVPMKTKETAERVLAPKVRGTLSLDAALEGRRLDFFVVFSSTSAILGPAGQIDYAAANAFLNAFARARTSSGLGLTIAIGWGVWNGIGMAADAARRLGHQAGEPESAPAGVDVSHPLLRRQVSRSNDDIVYETEYAVDDLWVLNEHRLQSGAALVPGTAYLEMAHAALALTGADGPIVVRDVSFVSPLQIGDRERRRVRLSLTRRGDGYDFTIASLVAAGAGGTWQEHASGTVESGGTSPSTAVDLDAVRARCHRVALSNGTPLTLQDRHLRLGPRWQNIAAVHFGSGEGVAALNLPDRFAGDLADFTLHPALLDMATGFPLLLVDGYDPADMYVPLSYQSVQVWKKLPQRVLCYAHATADSQREAATFDVALFDDAGERLADVEGLVVRRIANPASLSPSAHAPAANQAASTAPAAPLPDLLQLAMDGGITPAEGIDAFRRVLAHALAPEIVASSFPLDGLRKRLAAVDDAAATAVPKQSRPATMRGSFVAPSTELERQIAAVWQEILGVDQVGIKDNFFDLGGHSLLAVRLFTRLKKIAGRTLPLSTLFDAPTIEQLARQLGDREMPQKPLSSIVPIQPSGSKPPLFGIHGMGGNVVEFSHLARYLTPDQPFFGIQARGLDGKHAPLTRVEDFAAHYISEMKSVQPDGPYYICGSSFGGLVGYEIAQQLQARGERVALLALFDSYGRDYPKRLPAVTRFRDIVNGERLRWELHSSNLRLLPMRGKIEYCRDKTHSMVQRLWWRGMKAVDRVERRIRILFLPRVLRDQFRMTGEDPRVVKGIDVPRAIRDVQVGVTQAARQYELRAYSGPVTLFRATNQPPDIYPDTTNGWGELVGRLVVHDIVGHHGAIVREPRVRQLATVLNEALRAVQAADRRAEVVETAALDESDAPREHAVELGRASIAATADADVAEPAFTR